MFDAQQFGEFLHLEPVIKEYASALRVALRLHRPFRSFSKPREEPGFHLHLFALPRQFPWMPVIYEVKMVGLPIAFGHPLREGARQLVTLPGRLAKGPAVPDDEGRALAYVQRRNIFVLFDLAGQPEDLATLLLRLLLDRALGLMSEDLAAQSGLHPDRIQFILAGLRRTTGLQEWTWRQHRSALTRSRFHEGRLEQLGGEISFLESQIQATEEECGTRSPHWLQRSCCVSFCAVVRAVVRLHKQPANLVRKHRLTTPPQHPLTPACSKR